MIATDTSSHCSWLHSSMASSHCVLVIVELVTTDNTTVLTPQHMFAKCTVRRMSKSFLFENQKSVERKFFFFYQRFVLNSPAENLQRRQYRVMVGSMKEAVITQWRCKWSLMKDRPQHVTMSIITMRWAMSSGHSVAVNGGGSRGWLQCGWSQDNCLENAGELTQAHRWTAEYKWIFFSMLWIFSCMSLLCWVVRLLCAVLSVRHLLSISGFFPLLSIFPVCHYWASIQQSSMCWVVRLLRAVS